MNKKLKSYWLGILGEYYAIIFLFFKGYKIIKRRYKTKLGEIDIIAVKADNLIAFEVKTRSYSHATVEDAFNYAQFYRIFNALKIFLNKNEGYSKFNIRIDAILICNNFRVKHFKNIWCE